MNPEEYREAQSKITQGVHDHVFSVLSRLRSRRITQRQFTKVVGLLLPSVRRGRADSLKQASVFYDAQREENNAAGHFDSSQVYDVTYQPTALAKALEPARSPLLGLREFEKEEVTARLNEAASWAGMHAEQAGRDGIVHMSNNDPGCLGWARIDPKPPTCEFCLMLISRGVVYSGKTSATQKTSGGSYHLDDTCVAIPVFTKRGYPGADQHEEANRIYVEAIKLLRTRGVKTTGRSEVIAAMRIVRGTTQDSTVVPKLDD